MKNYIECYPCFLKQAVEASKMATNNEEVRWEILKKASSLISIFPNEETPPALGKAIHSIVRDCSKSSDPYRRVKDEYNHKALNLIPFIDKTIEVSQDRFITAVKFLAIANIIDFGPFNADQIDLNKMFNSKLESEFKGKVSIQSFINSIKKANNILYVADNCGEIVIDTYFINNFLSDKEVTLSVKGSPILNDATRKDLEHLCLSKNITVIDNGDNAPGTILKNCSQDFLDSYKNADLVILKGQGNFEGVGKPERKNVYSILVAKCPVIARHINCEINDLVITIPD